jgi:hypothetical protein
MTLLLLFYPSAPPKHVSRKARLRPSSIRHFLVRRSLIPSQNRDVEKDAPVHQETASKPESGHPLDVLNLSTKLRNPLAGRDKGTLEAGAVHFCEKHGLMEHGLWWYCRFVRRPLTVFFV